MKHIFISLFSLLLIGFSVIAQEDNTCGSDFVYQREISSNPQFARAMLNLNSRLVLNNSGGNTLRDDLVYTIPTVVHIIHIGEDIGEGTNISDEQIQSAITALNEDFRKIAGSNGDGDGVDVGIEFCLALRDPEGNSTNGIVRVDGSILPDYATEGISVGDTYGADEDDVKSLSVWPREDYLNIWIVNEIENNDGQSGIQGFAYFPTPNLYDGVTILYNSFGTVGNLKPYTDLNKTTTHEVGHFLGLYHTFHSSNDCVESNCETQGDRVCDTPVTVLNSSCSNPECSGNQQVENYMDYTNQSCKNMFSEGQKVRMRFTLLEGRPTLLNSLGCSPVSNFDAGITNVSEPSGSLCSASIFPVVTLTNFGGQTLNEIEINYQIVNNALQSYTWTGDLSSGQSEEVSLPIIIGGSGSQTLYAYTSNPNSQTDEISSNDGSNSSFIVSSGASIDLVFTLDYFGSENTWEITQNGGEVMAQGGPFIDNSPGSEITESVCLPAGCYTFSIYDEQGDGQGFLTGSYEIFDPEGNSIASGNNNWGDSASHEICLSEPNGDPPSANFSLNDNSICSGDQINFSDGSSDTPTSWFWEFEGGSPSTSSNQNPQNITYNTPGTYDVTLTVANDFGSNSTTMSNSVSVENSPSIFITTSDVLCHGQANGSANADIDGASIINWSQGSAGNSVSGLSAGNYSLEATSANGCESAVSFSITEPENLNLTLFKADVSCFNSFDGEVSSTVSGGVSPYSYSWSNGSTNSSITDLDQGIYTLTVTDANGCSLTESVSIIQPSEIVVTTEVLTSESCLGNDGSGLANAMGGNGNLSYLWSNEQEGQNLENVGFGTYQVYVTDDLGCSSEEDVFIPYDCEDILPTTQLEAEFCDKGSFQLSDNIKCNQIENAEMYLWEFSDHSGSVIEEAYTLGNNNTFLISNIPFAAHGSSFDVKLKVQLSGEWGEWGTSCNVDLAELPDPISLVAEDCNAGLFEYNHVLQAEMNTGADEYEWVFEYNDMTESYFTYTSQFSLSQELLFPENQSISVKIRALYTDIWSEFGDECNFMIDNSNSIIDIEIKNSSLLIYPNPNGGEEFSLEIDNLLGTDHVIDIKVFSSDGKLVFQTNTEKTDTQFSETYSFENKLSRGTYLIQVSNSGKKYQQKLIVK